MSTVSTPDKTITILYVDAEALNRMIRTARRQRRKGNILFWTGLSLVTIYIIRDRSRRRKKNRQ